MLETSTHVALAQELRESERSRKQIQQFSKRYPTLEMADSYAIQREWMKLERAGGRSVIGHKIGLTSRAMQLASQITEPDYGTLLDSMLIRDGSEWRHTKVGGFGSGSIRFSPWSEPRF